MIFHMRLVGQRTGQGDKGDAGGKTYHLVSGAGLDLSHCC